MYIRTYVYINTNATNYRERERQTHTQHIKSRQVTSGKK